MRGVLEAYNLSDSYLPGGRPTPVDCTNKRYARQADGTCNDLDDSMMGAAGVRFGHNIPVFVPNAASPTGYAPNPHVYPNPATLMEPNPRTVSRVLFTRDEFKPQNHLNLLATAWIQFQIHDWFSHGDSNMVDVFHVPLDADDPLRRHHITQMTLGRTVQDPRAGAEQALLPPASVNEVTHWWDASQVYGSDKATADSLRDQNKKGKLRATLKMGPRGLLPRAADGFERTGMRRNFWVGLGLMHNLFAHEHNAIVEKLRESHPEFDEQKTYEVARLINAATIAKIHTLEWTLAILPNRTLSVGMHANWSGLKSFLAEGTDTAPLLAYIDTLPPTQRSGILAAIDGVLGNERNLHNAPFAMSEEFVSIYRMHPLLPDSIDIRTVGMNRALVRVPTESTREKDGRLLEDVFGVGNLLYSFGNAYSGALVNGNYPSFLQELKLPFGIVDMGTVDILRDRERGLPRYNDFREQLRLKRFPSIEALTDDPALREKLHQVYGDDEEAINRVDALVGTFAESQRPDCYGFGETLFQVFTLMATRRLQADRFFTTDYRPEVYTEEGMQWIEEASFKAVLLRHYPELASTGLMEVENAFYPWR